MNRKEHVNIGLIVGGVATGTDILIKYKEKGSICAKDIFNSLGILAGSYIGSMLPDMIEPATAPNHREFAHSYTVMLGDFMLLSRYIVLKKEKNFWDNVIIGVVLGYLSHLIADSTTPKGLPIV